MLEPREQFQCQTKVENPLGLHARPATEIAAYVQSLEGVTVKLRCGEVEAAGDRPLQILLLCAQKGAEIGIEVQGRNSRVIAERISELVRSPHG
jgi:phosphotransferase system HPr (HPr) family protein